MRYWIHVGPLLLAFNVTTCAEQAERVPVATAGDLSIYDAYAPASAAPDVASLYFTVVNGGSVEDTLIEIRLVEGRAELHDVVTEEGLTRMQHVPVLPIPAGDTVRLAPGGYHVMLMGLSAPLEVGGRVPVGLVFARSGIARVLAQVLTYSDVVERLEAAAEP